MHHHYRYGFYLRPDLALARAQAEIHDLLKRQYGLVSAGLFMPHCTIKGFFLSPASPEAMILRLDERMRGWRAFTVHNQGAYKMGPVSIVLSVRNLPDGRPNPGLFELQDRAWAALGDLIDPACTFTTRDGRGLDGSHPFHPHFTLAMADVRPDMQDEIFEFVSQRGLIGPAMFTANVCHLFRFKADWEGAWWHTLSWELLHSWRAEP